MFYFAEKAGGIRATGFTGSISWKDWICAVKDLEEIEAVPIVWIGLSFPVLISAGAWRPPRGFRSWSAIWWKQVSGFNCSRRGPVDNFSRKCLGIYPDKSIKGEDVVSFIKHVTCLNKARPNRIQVDNGSEHSMSDSSQKPWINGPTIIKSC